MLTVRQILKTKGDEVYSIGPDATVLDALQKMADKEIGALLVMEGDKVLGIFSERDYARRGILQGVQANVKVSQLMTRAMIYVGPDQTVEECMGKMTDKRIRHLPVVEEGKLIGLISIGDIVKAIISDQKSLIRDMEDYIQGRGYPH